MNKTNLPILIIAIFLLLLPNSASAHCPLCTAGAGALAILAASLGVSTIVVGVFIGAASLAMGIWIARSITKKYLKFQDSIVTIFIFLGTILPIMPLIREYRPLYIPWLGDYGTTYSINIYLVGAFLGAILLGVSAPLSKYVTKLTDKKLPFQTMIIAFALLFILGVILQLTVD